MNRQRFNKNFDEIGRKSQVKMHKSGKNWIRTVSSQLRLLRVVRGSDNLNISLPTIENKDCLDNRGFDYLRAVLISGIAMVGHQATPTVLAEEHVFAIEQEMERGRDTALDNDLVIVDTI